MCTVRRRHWHCSKLCDALHTHHQNSFRLYQTRRPEINHRRMPFWRYRNRVSGKNDHYTRSSTIRSKDQKILSQLQIPKVQNTSPAMHRICILQQNLHTQTIRNTPKILRTIKYGKQNNYHRRPIRQLQSNQYSPSRSVWSCPQTTNHVY